MIEITELAFAYHEKPVLKGLNARFEAGVAHGVVGLNGSGKTTFFNLVAGILQTGSGTITRDGMPLRRAEIAYIDAESLFYPNLTAREFLSVFPRTNLRYQETELSEVFAIPLDELIDHYSTGMKKKLLILSQLKQDKQLFIFDEPFNGLDLESNKSLQFLIRLLTSKGKTVLIASHVIEPLYNICAHIHHLKEGVFVKSYQPPSYHLLDGEVFHEFNEHIQHLLNRSI